MFPDHRVPIEPRLLGVGLKRKVEPGLLRRVSGCVRLGRDVEERHLSSTYRAIAAQLTREGRRTKRGAAYPTHHRSNLNRLRSRHTAEN